MQVFSMLLMMLLNSCVMGFAFVVCCLLFLFVVRCSLFVVCYLAIVHDCSRVSSRNAINCEAVQHMYRLVSRIPIRGSDRTGSDRNGSKRIETERNGYIKETIKAKQWNLHIHNLCSSSRRQYCDVL